MLQDLHNWIEKENASSIKVQYKRRHLNKYTLFLLIIFIKPQTLEKLKGHIALGLSVRPLQNL